MNKLPWVEPSIVLVNVDELISGFADEALSEYLECKRKENK